MDLNNFPNLMRNPISRANDGVFWAYHRLRSSWPVWYYLLNYRSRREWRKYNSENPLNAVQEKLAAVLQQDGIAVTHITELFPESDIFNKLSQYASSLAAAPSAREKIAALETCAVKAKGDLIVHLLGGYGGIKPVLSLPDPFIKFILSEKILGIAGAYLGSLPKFKMFSLHSTILRPENATPQFSQRWHRDPDDKKIVKVFLYLSDVLDERAGPFQYVIGSQHGGRWRNFYPQLPPVGRYPPDGEVERAVPKDNIRVCTGKAGAMIFCDTSGLHRGGYSTGERRLMFAGTFTSAASIQPQNFILEETSDLEALPTLAHLTLSK